MTSLPMARMAARILFGSPTGPHAQPLKQSRMRSVVKEEEEDDEKTKAEHIAILREAKRIQELADKSGCDRNQWPGWNPRFWNDPEHASVDNCYAYMVEDHQSIRERKHKRWPGELAGLPCPRGDELTKTEIVRRMKLDCPNDIFTDSDALPPAGYYQGCLLIANRPGMKDFHYARRDRNGLCSHKPGATPVTNVDADGKLIVDMRKANWNYDHKGDDTGFRYKFMCYIWIKVDEGMHASVLNEEYIRSNKKYALEPQFNYHVSPDYIVSDGDLENVESS